jgi:hypothetical protein
VIKFKTLSAVCFLLVVFLILPVANAQEVKETTKEEIEAQKKEKELQQKKEKIEEKVETTVETNSSNIATCEVSRNKVTTISKTPVTENNTENKFYFPENWFNLTLDATTVQSLDIKYSGISSKVSITQEQEVNKKTRWGMGAFIDLGKFQVSNIGLLKESYTGRVKMYGIFLALVKTNNRKSSVRTEIDLGLAQKTTTGNSSLSGYSEEQVDKMGIFDVYLNLSRDKEKSLFAQTDICFRYIYPLWVEKSASINGNAIINPPIYDSKMLYFQYNQAVLSFDMKELAKKLSLHIGFTAYYVHESENKRDSYGGLVWARLMYDFLDVINLAYGGQTANNVPSYEIIRGGVNIINAYYAFIK